MPVSTGIDRITGLPLSDLYHVRQCFLTLMVTRLGSRVMRRTVGAQVPGLLGRPLVPQTLALFTQAIAVAVYLWEPRLAIVQVLYPSPPNVPATLRAGGVNMTIVADYRPYGLQGDFTTGVQRITL